MMRHFRLTTLVALFVVISAVAAAAQPYAYISQSGTSTVFIVNTGTVPPSAADISVPPIAVPANRTPWGVALSPDGGTLYVTNFAFGSAGSVMAFKTSDGSLIREVPVGSLPFGIAVHPTNGDVYATVTFNGARVTTIHASTFVNLGAPPVTTSVGMPSPRGVAVNPAGTLLYVTSFATDALYVFNLPLNPLEEPTIIPMSGGVRPLGVATSPDGSKVYVANQLTNNLAVINAANNAATYVPVGNAPMSVAVSPDGLEVYVTNSLSGTVSVLDAGGIPLGSEIVVGLQPFGIATDGVYVYVAVFSSTGKIVVIDRSTRAKTDIPAPFPIGFGKFVNPAMKIATVMSLALSTESIIVGSTAPITATATLQRKNNGAPVADASIVFTVTGPSGAVANGTAVTGANGAAPWSFSASTFAVGTYTVAVAFSESKIGSNVYLASDAARTLSVRYAFAWVRPTNGSTTGVNAGSTVPVHWSVTDANGTAISDLSIVTGMTSAPCDSGASTAAASAKVRASSAGGSDLRFNSEHFMYNWRTDKEWAGSCRQFIVQLNDGSSHSQPFQFK